MQIKERWALLQVYKSNDHYMISTNNKIWILAWPYPHESTATSNGAERGFGRGAEPWFWIFSLDGVPPPAAGLRQAVRRQAVPGNRAGGALSNGLLQSCSELCGAVRCRGYRGCQHEKPPSDQARSSTSPNVTASVTMRSSCCDVFLPRGRTIFSGSLWGSYLACCLCKCNWNVKSLLPVPKSISSR